ncbi:MAG: sensor histidine kinase [Verrucomicrobiota bacterium]
MLPTIEAISIVEPARFFNTKRLLILLSITLGTLLLVTGGALLLARRNIGLLAEMRERGAVAAERSRLARDLHDTLEQGLTGLHLHLHSIGPSVDEASEETQKRLGTIRSLVQQCHSELRQSIWNLRTSAVDPFDLGEALERIAHSLVLGSAIHVELRQQRAPVKIPSLVEDNLLRIGQEALTNVVKHANAFRLRIALTISRRHVTLAISDDGRGFQTGDHAGASSGHFGILGMRERAARIGGTLTLHSTPQSGCLVQVDVPLRERTQTFPSSP